MGLIEDYMRLHMFPDEEAAFNDRFIAFLARNFIGSGNPEGVVTAPPASAFWNTDGGDSTTLYVKESGTGNTGWVAYGAGGGGGGLTTEQVQDIVGAMFSGNTETGIAATYEDSDGTIDLVAEVTQAELDAVSGAIPTTEQIQDLVGAMFSGNTELGVTAEYQDSDGTIDLSLNNVLDVQGPVATPATGAETDLFNANIPTDVLADDVIEFSLGCSLLHNNAASTNYTFRIYIGTTNVLTFTFNLGSGATSANTRAINIRGEVYILSTSSQVVSWNISGTAAGAATTKDFNAALSGIGSENATEDLVASAKALRITAQISVANAAEIITMKAGRATIKR